MLAAGFAPALDALASFSSTLHVAPGVMRSPGTSKLMVEPMSLSLELESPVTCCSIGAPLPT